MKHLKMPMFPDTASITPEQLMPLTQQVILGSAVCITEGIAASIAFMLPKGLTFYLGGFAILVLVWLAMRRFNSSKLGADICDLYLYEVFVWAFATTFFLFGKSTTIFWYFMTFFLYLRLFRVYLWQGTITHDYGWGVFGPSTRSYARKNPLTQEGMLSKKALAALLICCVFAAIATLLHQQLSDKNREMLPWALAFVYIIINGPTLLNALSNFAPQYIASLKRDAENEAKKAILQQHIETFKKKHNLPDDKSALMLATFLSIHDIKRDHLIELAQILAERYPADPSGPAS